MNRVVQKLQFPRELKFTTNYRLKTAKCRAFCETCQLTELLNKSNIPAMKA
jgi:hypothetical protein